MRSTDWDQYYDQTFWAARLTRAYTTKRLLAHMARCRIANPSIVEFGGGNSCFFEKVHQALRPSSYTVVDSNKKSLTMFLDRFGGHSSVRAVESDFLSMEGKVPRADIVFSVGLIEHFPSDRLTESLAAHFDQTRSGGLVIISFPTPTVVYRMLRGIIEKLGRWQFPDEIPLGMENVAQGMRREGTIRGREVLWPILLSQGMISVEKKRTVR